MSRSNRNRKQAQRQDREARDVADEAARQGARARRALGLRLGAGALMLGALIAGGIWMSGRASGPQPGMPPSLVPGAADGFNVLVITLDTVRSDRLGSYGHVAARTPNLDGLMQGGVRFDDAVTVAPVTLPSHATIFTGLYPPNHGARRNGEFTVGAEQTTLAEMFSERGYDTAAFIGAFVLDARFGLGQGFDVYDDEVTGHNSLDLGDSFEERKAGAVTDAALAWLSARDSERPFFAWVHYFDPHKPWTAPAGYGAGYDGEIAYVDAQIGRLLEALDDRSLRDRTLIVLTADHGEGLGEHAEPTHDFFIYDSVMQIPLILNAPGLVEGSHVVADRVVSTVDLFPTVAALVGFDPGGPLDGESLLGGGPDPDRGIYMESLAPYMDNGWAALFALRSHDEKYIRAPRPELYALRRDPGELRNLIDDGSGADAAADALEVRLEAMLEGWASPESVAQAAEAMDGETREKLRALGYVGGAGPDSVLSMSTGRLDPKDGIELFNEIDRAKALARAGRVEEALGVLRRVDSAAPRNRMVLGEMARLYATMNRTTEAEGVLRRSIDIQPSPVTLTLLAQVLIAQGRYAEVDGLAQHALELDSQHGLAYIVLGDLAAQQGQREQAGQYYVRALEVDPYRSEAAVAQRRGWLRQRREPSR